MSEETIDHEARGGIARLEQKIDGVRSYFDDKLNTWTQGYDARLTGGLATVRDNDVRNSAGMIAMEGRLNTKISETEGRMIIAINEVKAAVSSGSTRFWDTSTKIILSLVAAIFSIAMLYVTLGRHP